MRKMHLALSYYRVFLPDREPFPSLSAHLHAVLGSLRLTFAASRVTCLFTEGSEVFRVKKSNHSKKIVKQLKKEYKEDLEKSGHVKQEIKSGERERERRSPAVHVRDQLSSLLSHLAIRPVCLI